MNICVLGNSQVACIKSAWDIPENRPTSDTLTFFAAFGLSLGNLTVAGNKLVPATEALKRHMMYTAGVDEIDPSGYDAFLICGAGLGFRPVDARLSRQVLRTLCNDLLKSSLAYSLAAKVRSISSAPIYIMPAPLLDERTADRAKFSVANYRDYIPLMKEALDIPNTTLLEQPDDTITRGHYTRLEYSQDAVRLAVSDRMEGVSHKEDDYNHMNAKYGAVRLKDFFAKIELKAA